MSGMLTRTGQIGFKIQASPGVEEVLAAADYAGRFSEVTHRLEAAEYSRENINPALSAQGLLKGSRMQEIHFTQEWVGGSATTHAPAAVALQGLGFTPTQLKSIAVGATTGGSFRIGQKIGNNAVEGSATKTGIFVKFVAGSPNRVWYVPVTGTFASADTIYNYASPQVSATASANPIDGGFRYAPISETSAAAPPVLTVERRIGGERHTITDARGTGGLTLRRDEPLKLRAEFKGVGVFDANGDPRTGAFVGSVPVVGVAPVMAKSIPVVIRQGVNDVKLTMTELPISIDNQVELDPTLNDNDFAGSGYREAMITGRRITVTMDPKRVLASVFGLQALLLSGAAFELIAEVGAVMHGNGLLIAHAPAVQISGGLDPGDRNGQLTSPFTMLATGLSDDEFFLYQCF